MSKQVSDYKNHSWHPGSSIFEKTFRHNLSVQHRSVSNAQYNKFYHGNYRNFVTVSRRFFSSDRQIMYPLTRINCFTIDIF